MYILGSLGCEVDKHPRLLRIWALRGILGLGLAAGAFGVPRSASNGPPFDMAGAALGLRPDPLKDCVGITQI